MQKKKFFLARALACEPATLSIRIYASHGIAAVETACNKELLHIAGFGATHWSSLERIVRTVFFEIEFQIQTDRQTDRTDDRDFRNYS